MQTTIALFVRTLSTVSALVVLALLACFPTKAATLLYWDADGDATAATGGTGFWDTTSANWRIGSETGLLTTWIDGAAPRFGGTAGTVTLTANVAVDGTNGQSEGSGGVGGGIFFKTAGYTLAGSNTLTINDGSDRPFNGNTTVTVNSPLHIARNGLVYLQGSTVTVNGDITVGGSATQIGGWYGTLALNGSNSFGATGGNGGYNYNLVIGSNTALGTGKLILSEFPGSYNNTVAVGPANLTIANLIETKWNQEVRFAGNNSLTLSSDQVYYPLTDSLNDGFRINVQQETATITFQGLTEVSQDRNGSFRKMGDGTVVINGQYGCGGSTYVSAGTLILNGSTGDKITTGYQGQKNYTVYSDATLGGNGTINLASGQAVTVNAGGTLAPGASVGTLTVNGDVNLDGTLAIEIDGDGSADLLDVNGLLDMDLTTSVLKISFIDSYLPSATQTWTIFDLTGMTVNGGFSSFDLEIAGSDFSWNTDNLFIDGTITTKIPEPASIALLGLAALTVIRRRQG